MSSMVSSIASSSGGNYMELIPYLQGDSGITGNRYLTDGWQHPNAEAYGWDDAWKDIYMSANYISLQKISTLDLSDVMYVWLRGGTVAELSIKLNRSYQSGYLENCTTKYTLTLFGNDFTVETAPGQGKDTTFAWSSSAGLTRTESTYTLSWSSDGTYLHNDIKIDSSTPLQLPVLSSECGLKDISVYVPNTSYVNYGGIVVNPRMSQLKLKNGKDLSGSTNPPAPIYKSEL